LTASASYPLTPSPSPPTQPSFRCDNFFIPNGFCLTFHRCCASVGGAATTYLRSPAGTSCAFFAPRLPKLDPSPSLLCQCLLCPLVAAIPATSALKALRLHLRSRL
jgi:hypothetical protein